MTRLPPTDSDQPHAAIDDRISGRSDSHTDNTTSTVALHSKGWKRVLLWSAVGVLAFVLSILLLGAAAQSFIGHERQLLHILQIVQQWHVVGVIVQCAIVTLVIVRWKALVDWAAARGIVQGFERDRALAYRGKAATFLLLYLILIPIGPHRIWLLLAG